MNEPDQNTGARPALGALASLLAALSCCLPFGPVIAAAGAAGASAFLVSARPWLMGLSVGLLAWGFRQAYTARACNARPALWSRALLWIALAANGAFLFFPQQAASLLAGPAPGSATPARIALHPPESLRADFNAAASRTRLLVLLSPT
jgi:hypothetical protein